ncbi:MAG TPA: alpha/beta hydrolase [Polyangiaceae bacterium]|nr:alpha/beta hydrolase [Polyangiaceae bacterium]
MVAAGSATRRPWKRWVPLLVAGVLGLLAVVSHTPDLPREMLEQKYGGPESKFLLLPTGARVHYRDRGSPDAPVVVLLHGSNASLHTWEPWVKILSGRFRVVTLDLQGHGLTGPVPGDDYSLGGMVAFLDEFRRRLGLDHFALVGNSMGGSVSWRFALAHPDVVTALVLIDSGGVDHLLSPEHAPVRPIGFRIMRVPGLNRIAEFATPRRVIEKSLLGTLHDPRQVTPEMVDRYYELLLYPGNRRATRIRNGTSPDEGAVDRLTELHVPTLILWGAEDKLRNPEAARIFQSRVKGAKVIVYPDVGHVPMEEIPERSAADTLGFLEAVAG